MSKVSIMIPCYNEELTIFDVVTKWRKILPEADIYVYDNKSTDKTIEKAKETGAIIRTVKKKGKGNVVKRMFEDNESDCLIMVDGDDTYSEQQARKMVALVLEKKYDMVIGTRLSTGYFEENKKLTHSFGNILVRTLINILFDGTIKDALSGCRAFSYDLTKKMSIESQGFEIETEITINSLTEKMSIKNIPVQYVDRKNGSKSKINTYKDGMKILKTIIKMYIVERIKNERK